MIARKVLLLEEKMKWIGVSVSLIATTATTTLFGTFTAAQDPTACQCNGNTARMSAMIPPLDVTVSDLTYPNIALEAAYIALSLIPGTGGEPHKIAMVGAAMYETYAVFEDTAFDPDDVNDDNDTDMGMDMDDDDDDWKPLTSEGQALKDSMPMTDMMTIEELVGYASYDAMRRVLMSTPDQIELLDEKMTALGYDPALALNNPTSSIVMAVLMKYSLGPMPDYVPMNPASTILIDAECETLVDSTKWQAQCMPTPDGGTCMSQQIPFGPFYDAKLITDDGNRTVRDRMAGIIPQPPTGVELETQHALALEASSTLDDTAKFMSEFFQPNAALRIGMLVVNEAEARNLDLEDSILTNFATLGAMRDSVAGSVTVKLDEDTVRPLTTIQCENRGEVLTTWNRPYMGVHEYVNSDNELWRPYLQTPPFPGYTSGHAGAAGAGTTILNKLFNDGMFMSNNCPTQMEGMSRTEPRITDPTAPGYIAGMTDVANTGPDTVGYAPGQDINLCFTSFTDFANQLAESRLFGGIHIPIDNDIGLAWGRHIGEVFYSNIIEDDVDDSSMVPSSAPVEVGSMVPGPPVGDDSSMPSSVPGDGGGSMVPMPPTDTMTMEPTDMGGDGDDSSSPSASPEAGSGPMPPTPTIQTLAPTESTTEEVTDEEPSSMAFAVTMTMFRGNFVLFLVSSLLLYALE